MRNVSDALNKNRKTYYTWKYIKGKLYRVQCDKNGKNLRSVLFFPPNMNTENYICV